MAKKKKTTSKRSTKKANTKPKVVHTNTDFSKGFAIASIVAIAAIVFMVSLTIKMLA